MHINICKDFSETLGARYRREGLYSGEEFRESILIPKFKEAIKNNEDLMIDLDGGYGYPTSFLEEAFGGLARKFKDRCKSNLMLKTLKFKSDDEPSLIDEIEKYILDAYK